MASIVSAAIDVVLAAQDELPARIAVLEQALTAHPKAAEALAAARVARMPAVQAPAAAAPSSVVWTEKTLTEQLSGKLRAMSVISKGQAAAIRSYVGSAMPAADLNLLLDDLKTAKGPRNIARVLSRCDGDVITLIVTAINDQ